MQGLLHDKKVLITGASRGIGFEISKRFLAEGADVLGIAKDEARLSSAAQRLALQAPGRFRSLAVDLAVPGCAHRLVEWVVREWGSLDLLVANAAIMAKTLPGAGFTQEPPGTLEHTLELNLLSPFRITLALLPLLRASTEPRVVLVSSGAGTRSGIIEPGLASYRLSKWALNGLTLMLAKELEGQVQVNALDPGWVKTDLGGPNAPGSPVESAAGALALATSPWKQTGRLWKDGLVIDY
jgi:NAD(P)-dependent dehydrogenase (short-subunit alcohol dehydrogenase family)